MLYLTLFYILIKPAENIVSIYFSKSVCFIEIPVIIEFYFFPLD